MSEVNLFAWSIVCVARYPEIRACRYHVLYPLRSDAVAWVFLDTVPVSPRLVTPVYTVLFSSISLPSTVASGQYRTLAARQSKATNRFESNPSYSSPTLSGRARYVN